MATCARQLLFSMEDRDMLGHWRNGTEMPNLYDRAECETELRLRNTVIERIHEGWRPAHAFEIAKSGAAKEELASSSSGETSVTSTASTIQRKRNENIADSEE